MKSVKIVAIVAAIAVCVKLGFSVAAEGDASSEPKYTIKDVMKVAHKEGLLKKVLGGSSSSEDQKKLLDLYLSLLENKAPKGDDDSWHKLSGGAVIAAAKVVVGRDGATAELKKATNCATCHKAHKPPSK